MTLSTAGYSCEICSGLHVVGTSCPVANVDDLVDIVDPKLLN